MSCTKKGEDMSLKTFRNALKYGDEYNTVGGGEPTLHPFFWQMLMEAIAVSDVWMATNGSLTEIALALAGLAKKGVLGVALSLDEFHDPISPKVVEAFTKDMTKTAYGSFYADDDKRETRNVSGNLIKAGRCKDGKEGCICEDMIVKPNGIVKACGCKDAPIFGNVNHSPQFELPDWYMPGECFKAREVDLAKL
jgi:hypothetical protein